MKFDVTFDFTSDTPHYWDQFWETRNGLGYSKQDPDASSKTMRLYHQYVWSKTLPNGEAMQLELGSRNEYLRWKNFRFGSDSITASFRYERYREMLGKVEASMQDYHTFMEDYLRKTYTIGGAILFPKRHGGINQARGCNPHIKDRWDLTLECIRRYYEKEDSPLYEV